MVFVVTASVWITVFFAVLWAYSKPEFLRKKQEAYAPRLKPSEAPFLCLTNYDDEAFGILSVVEGICNLPFLLLSPWLLLPYMAAAVGLTLYLLMPREWADLVVFIPSVYLYGAIFYFGLFLLAYVAAVVSRGLSQGLWHPLAAYLVRDVVSLVPYSVGSVEFRELEVETKKSELAHSVLYDNEEVVEEIVKWVKATLDRRTGGPSLNS